MDAIDDALKKQLEAWVAKRYGAEHAEAHPDVQEFRLRYAFAVHTKPD